MFKKFVIQVIKFVGISGIGWILDFTVYNLLHFLSGLVMIDPVIYGVDICNVISSFCGFTFVFFVSTRKTFDVDLTRMSLGTKYLIYILYQIVTIALASVFVGWLGNLLAASDIRIISSFAWAGAKICVTPITMACNFVMMKIISEKI